MLRMYWDIGGMLQQSQDADGWGKGRIIEVLHTPGHSPGHMCFWESSKGYLFTGDLVYKGTLTAWFPSTDPEAYLKSLKMTAAFPVKKVFPAHHSLDIQPEILIRMQDAFENLKVKPWQRYF